MYIYNFYSVLKTLIDKFISDINHIRQAIINTNTSKELCSTSILGRRENKGRGKVGTVGENRIMRNLEPRNCILWLRNNFSP